MFSDRTGDPRGVPADAATVGFFHSNDWKLEDGMWVPDRDGEDPGLLGENDDCLHELLEESLPPNQRGGPHNLACNCPKCRVVC